LLLAPAPEAARLYERLGVRPLPRSAYWFDRVFSRGDLTQWKKTPPENRVAALDRLRRDFDAVADDSVGEKDFGAWIATLELLWDDSGRRFFGAAEARDATEALHREFKPHQIVATTLRTTVFAPFLARLGAKPGVDRAALLDAARAVDGDPRRAAVVVTALFKNGPSLVAEAGDDGFFAELGAIPLASPAYDFPMDLAAAFRQLGDGPSRQRRGSQLVPFAGAVVPSFSALREHASCWSRRTVVRGGGDGTLVLSAKLGASPEASAEDVAAHLVGMASLAPALLRAHDDARPRGSTRSRRAPTVEDQMSYACESLGYAVTAGGATEARSARRTVGDAPILLLRRSTGADATYAFAPAARVFDGLTSDDDAPPLVLSADDRLHAAVVAALARYPGLGPALGMRRRPAREDLRFFAAELGSGPLDGAGVEAAARLCRLEAAALTTAAGTEVLAPLPVPDASGRLRSATEVLYDDAPWLAGRLDRSRVPLAHGKVERRVAAALGCRPLSRAVDETAGAVTPRPAETLPPAVAAAVAQWRSNARAPAFRAALRRAHARARLLAVSETTAPVLDAGRLESLKRVDVVAAERLESRFDLAGVDVTRDAKGSPALVVPGASPTIYLRLDVDGSGNVRPGWRRRWKPAVAIALDRYLGADAVGERALIAELLAVDDVVEMTEVLEMWEIPALELDPRLGVVEEDDDLAVQSEAAVAGDRVLVELDDETVVAARVEQVLESSYVLAVTPELECVERPLAALRRKRSAAERSPMARPPMSRATSADDAAAEDLAGRASTSSATAPADDEYRAAQGWEATEDAARAAVVARERAAVLEPEPPGIDGFLLAPPPAVVDSKPVASKDAVAAVTKRERVSPGFDLVRIGNFSEAARFPKEIAFFHHRPTVAQIYDEAHYGRQRLVKQCCGALRDVCGVFGYDPAKVTLFYEPGSVSRFVRQKLFFNLHPVEARRDAEGLGDVRKDAFVYCYFYGLCVHKLAHFFDVVHGSRHDFFMTEYRCNYTLAFISLLARRGFDAAEVERRFADLVHREVN